MLYRNWPMVVGVVPGTAAKVEPPGAVPDTRSKVPVLRVTVKPVPVMFETRSRAARVVLAVIAAANPLAIVDSVVVAETYVAVVPLAVNVQLPTAPVERVTAQE